MQCFRSHWMLLTLHTGARISGAPFAACLESTVVKRSRWRPVEAAMTSSLPRLRENVWHSHASRASFRSRSTFVLPGLLL